MREIGYSARSSRPGSGAVGFGRQRQAVGVSAAGVLGQPSQGLCRSDYHARPGPAQAPGQTDQPVFVSGRVGHRRTGPGPRATPGCAPAQPARQSGPAPAGRRLDGRTVGAPPGPAPGAAAAAR